MTIKIQAKDIESKVLEIVASSLKCEKEKISLDSHIVNDLGADSLDTVELVMALEDEFEYEISDDEAAKIIIVRHIVEHLEIHLKKKEK